MTPEQLISLGVSIITSIATPIVTIYLLLKKFPLEAKFLSTQNVITAAEGAEKWEQVYELQRQARVKQDEEMFVLRRRISDQDLDISRLKSSLAQKEQSEQSLREENARLNDMICKLQDQIVTERDEHAKQIAELWKRIMSLEEVNKS